MKNQKKVIFIVNTLNDLGGIHTLVDSFAHIFSNEFEIEPVLIAINGNRKGFENYIYENQYIVKSFDSSQMQECINLLKNKKNVVISLQFGAHFYFQKYIKTKQSFLIFAGNTKKIGEGRYFVKHLNLLKEKYLYNYSKIILLSEQSCIDMANKLDKDGANKCEFANSFTMIESEDYYCKNNEYAIISRIDADKNLEIYIKIAKLINENTILHFYGDGNEKQKFVETILKNNLQDKIILHGYTNIQDALKNKNGLILGSYHEGVPFVILEANKKHVPCVCFDTFSSANELIIEGTGHVYAYNNIQSLIETLDSGLLRNKEQFEIVSRTFSYDNSCAQWQKILNGKNKLVKPNKEKKYMDKKNLIPQEQLLDIFK